VLKLSREEWDKEVEGKQVDEVDWKARYRVEEMNQIYRWKNYFGRKEEVRDGCCREMLILFTFMVLLTVVRGNASITV